MSDTVHRVNHEIRQRLHITCRHHPACLFWHHQLRRARDICRQYRTARSHGLHNNHRQPFGKRRDHQSMSVVQLPSHARL